MIKEIYKLPKPIVAYAEDNDIELKDIDGLYDIDIVHIRNMLKLVKKANEKVKKYIGVMEDERRFTIRDKLYTWIILNNLNRLRYDIHKTDTPYYKFVLPRKFYRSIVYKFKTLNTVIDVIFIEDTTYIINRKFYRLKRVEDNTSLDNSIHLDNSYYLVKKETT